MFIRKEDMSKKALILNSLDNVATALCETKKDELINLAISGKKYEIKVLQEIPFGHKFALKDICIGEKIYKFGYPIGKAIKEIKKGEWVHIHNLTTIQYEV